MDQPSFLSSNQSLFNPEEAKEVDKFCQSNIKWISLSNEFVINTKDEEN
jgi:hypothetical protein